MSLLSKTVHAASTYEFWERAATFAPLATASMAALAAFLAWRAIRAQRDIARKRAAIDFFLKSEMDTEIVEHYDTFRAKEERFRDKDEAAIAAFRAEKESGYEIVRAWLNILELLAVGVHNKAFEEDVAFHYWRNVVTKGHGSASVLITHARNMPQGLDGPETYCELEKLAKSWERRIRRENSWIRRVLFLRR